MTKDAKKLFTDMHNCNGPLNVTDCQCGEVWQVGGQGPVDIDAVSLDMVSIARRTDVLMKDRLIKMKTITSKMDNDGKQILTESMKESLEPDYMIILYCHCGAVIAINRPEGIIYPEKTII